mgnify:CR=1 FL=1
MSCVEVRDTIEFTSEKKNILKLHTRTTTYVQIFQEVIAHIQTGITIESMLDQFTCRIDQIQKFLSVYLLRSSKDKDFELFRYDFEKLFKMRTFPDVYVIHESTEIDLEL